jgi:PAS domain S-box-containing protein
MTTQIDLFLEYLESHPITVCTSSAVVIALVAILDVKTPNFSVGFLYLIPIIFAAPALVRWQIVTLGIVCSLLRAAFESAPESIIATSERAAFATAGYVMTGLCISALNQRRRTLAESLAERERNLRFREDAEQRVRVVIETSPLAILTLDKAGRVNLANESASQLFGFEGKSLIGVDAMAYLPTLCRMLQAPQWIPDIRTTLECKANRQNGDSFLAHVWLSTYCGVQGPAIAAVIWDASEDLRDREASELDFTISTSRVLMAAMSHEIRNLASAAASVYERVSSHSSTRDNEQFQVLGTLLEGLTKIAASSQANAWDLESAATDLSTVLYEARLLIEPGLREADIPLVWAVSENLPLVQADRHSLLQVFVNLARNSVRALENYPTRQIEVATEVQRDLVRLYFRDSGPGVPRPDELFQPFKTGTQGTGLGLYVSRLLMLARGGGLRYESTGKGSCFVIEMKPVAEIASELSH